MVNIQLSNISFIKMVESNKPKKQLQQEDELQKEEEEKKGGDKPQLSE